MSSTAVWSSGATRQREGGNSNIGMCVSHLLTRYQVSACHSVGSRVSMRCDLPLFHPDGITSNGNRGCVLTRTATSTIPRSTSRHSDQQHPESICKSATARLSFARFWAFHLDNPDAALAAHHSCTPRQIA